MKKLLIEKLVSLVLIFSLIFFQSVREKSQSVFKENTITKLAVLMYHGFTDGGKESTYVIDAKSLEEDIIWLKENGFSFLSPSDLIDYVDYSIPLPERCVMLTFDDGYLNNYLYAYPIIKKHNVKVTLSPIASCSDKSSQNPDTNPSYAHMTWAEIKEMSDSGLFEIQNHSYDMHTLTNGRKGSSKVSGENEMDYRRTFLKDLVKSHNAIKNATGKSPYVYAYPFGLVSCETRAILKCFGYRVSLGCEEGMNYITKDKDNLYTLKRFNRSNKTSARLLLDGY